MGADLLAVGGVGERIVTDQSAPDLFTDELDRARLMLEDCPTLGVVYELKPGVRRLLLRRTHYHLYFVEEPARVYVIAVWNVYRGRGPRL